MPNAFISKLRGYAPLDATDEALLQAACQHPRVYEAGEDLIREGDAPGPVFVVLEGWAIRYKILPGGGRQVIAFLMPGDFCDIHVGVLDEMDHSIGALTSARVAKISRARMETLTSERPALTRAFWRTQLVDEGILRATIVSMGRRTSLERVAHLLCELCLRMRDIGLASGERCAMPFTQIVLSDAVGMTPVHVNRVVGKLRREGAMEIGSSVVVANMLRLAQIAGFDDNYLHRRLRWRALPNATHG